MQWFLVEVIASQVISILLLKGGGEKQGATIDSLVD